MAHHPFFKRLNSSALTRQQVQKFALDYNFYCRCLLQLLGYAAAKIPTIRSEMPIVENLWEEHGEGDITKSHRQLYINFLRSLELSDEQIETSVPSTATARYVQDLFDICNAGDFLDILGLVGPRRGVLCLSRVRDHLRRTQEIPLRQRARFGILVDSYRGR